MSGLTLIEARRPVWGDAAHRFVLVMCRFRELPDLGEFQFMASLVDPEPHGKDIFRRCLAGDFGEIAEFDPATLPPAA